MVADGWIGQTAHLADGTCVRVLVRQANRYVQPLRRQSRVQPLPWPTGAGTQVEHLTRAGTLKRADQEGNHRRVGLEPGDHELQVIGFRVANLARTPVLVVDFKEVKSPHTFHIPSLNSE